MYCRSTAPALLGTSFDRLDINQIVDGEEMGFP